MNSKERVMNALNGKEVDRPPIDMFEGGSIYPELIRQKLLDYFKTDNWDDVLYGTGSDMRWLDKGIYGGPRTLSPQGKVTNPFGAIALEYEPLKNNISMEAIEKYPWPDGSEWDFSGLRKQAEKYSEYAIVAPYIESPVFCKISELISMEETLYYMYTEPEIIEAMIEKVNHYNHTFFRKVLEAAGDLMDIFWTWDDVAMQTGMTFDPQKWRQFYKKGLKKSVEIAKSYNLKVMYHCCGSPVEILPDLIEIGVDILSPVQTTATGMEPARLKKEFGKYIAFHGGIDTQHLLPYGTVKEVRETVRRNIEELGPRYIVGSSHCLNDLVPVENVIAMFEEVGSFRGIGCK